jgi:hypothetical protein
MGERPGHICSHRGTYSQPMLRCVLRYIKRFKFDGEDIFSHSFPHIGMKVRIISIIIDRYI